jgi:hypothetical protein
VDLEIGINAKENHPLWAPLSLVLVSPLTMAWRWCGISCGFSLGHGWEIELSFVLGD